MTKKLPYVKASTKLGLLKWRAAKEKSNQPDKKFKNLQIIYCYLLMLSVFVAHTTQQ